MIERDWQWRGWVKPPFLSHHARSSPKGAMQLRGALVALTSALLAAGAAARRTAWGIQPTLDPKSDKKFFGPPFPADYPSDGRPSEAGKAHMLANFKYPYPAAQESETYDKDYVA